MSNAIWQLLCDMGSIILSPEQTTIVGLQLITFNYDNNAIKIKIMITTTIVIM